MAMCYTYEMARFRFFCFLLVLRVVTAFDYAEQGADWYPELCPERNRQSPIDAKNYNSLPKTQVRPRFTFNINDAPTSISATDHDLKGTLDNHQLLLEMKEGDNTFTYEGINYHFHCKSEHQWDSQYADLEVHIVHQFKESTTSESFMGNTYAVLGIGFIEGSRENPFLGAILENENFPPAPESEIEYGRVVLDAVTGLVKNNSHIYTYFGSLTTPPCTESVNWYLLEERQEATKAQLDKFFDAIVKETDTGNWRISQTDYNEELVYQVDAYFEGSDAAAKFKLSALLVVISTSFLLA